LPFVEVDQVVAGGHLLKSSQPLQTVPGRLPQAQKAGKIEFPARSLSTAKFSSIYAAT
jgi:hypothetical protein